ncbi:MAG: cellulose binding domain-containing protein, partial [Micromonosporaceae bacterium]|nr:cellulose binding domain-containing protein [Micromonosporaceae bacterium]
MNDHSWPAAVEPTPGRRSQRTTPGQRKRAATAAIAVLSTFAATVAILANSSGTAVQAVPIPGTTKTGRATINSLGEVGLAMCSYPPEVIADKMYTAVPPDDFEDSGGCGSYLDVTGPKGKQVRVLIVDRCYECESGHLDMSPESFWAIAEQTSAVQQISYTPVKDPVLPGPVSVRVQTGSTEYWIGFLIMNHGNPLTRVEYRDPGGEWQPLTRTNYNYWQRQGGAGQGPFTLRLTDLHDRQVVLDGIELTPDVNQDTGIWMYQGGAPTPSASPTILPSISPSGPPASCSAEFRMDGSWPDGYQALLTVRNDSSTRVHPWQVTWTVPAGVTVTGWNGTFTQEGT